MTVLAANPISPSFCGGRSRTTRVTVDRDRWGKAVRSVCSSVCWVSAQSGAEWVDSANVSDTTPSLDVDVSDLVHVDGTAPGFGVLEPCECLLYVGRC